MKRKLFCVPSLAALALIPLLDACGPLVPAVTSCQTDAELPTKERESIGQVAVKFVDDSLSPTPSAAYTTFTAATRASLSIEQFMAGFQKPVMARGPFKDWRVTHIYRVQVTGGIQRQQVVCGDGSRPEGWVAVNAEPRMVEANVIVEGQTVNNVHAVVVRLRPEAENWRVHSVHFATTGMAGKSAEDLRRVAEVEHQRQHSFNAFILYTTAMQLADTGPFLRLGVRSKIEEEMTKVVKPSILEGASPFSWTFEGSTFKVMNVGPIGVGGKLYLLVDHEIEPWSQDKVADQSNRDLIAGLNRSVAEYKEAFAGLVIRAHERGGPRGFGTVHENDK